MMIDVDDFLAVFMSSGKLSAYDREIVSSLLE